MAWEPAQRDFQVSWSDGGGEFISPNAYSVTLPDTQGYFYKKFARAGMYRERQYQIEFQSHEYRFKLIGAEEDFEVLDR